MNQLVALNKPRNTDRAYIAAFFEAEGSISPSRNAPGKYHYVRIAIGQNDPSVLRWIQGFYGGNLQCRINTNKAGEQRNFYSLRIQKRDDVEVFLLDILPYCRIKRPRIDVALKIIRYKPDEPDTRLQLAAKLRKINHG